MKAMAATKKLSIIRVIARIVNGRGGKGDGVGWGVYKADKRP